MSDVFESHDSPLHGGHGDVATALSDDGVFYPSSDKMGESSLQSYVSLTLLMLLRDYFAIEGRAAFVGNNQFFYYRRGDPKASVSPDLYIIDGEARHPGSVPSWKVWEHDGKVPELVLEIVSDEYRKDYADELLERYQQLGVREIVRYDPGHRGPRRRLLSHFVRDDAGELIDRPVLPDRVRSAVFGFWLVIQPDRSMRLGLGPHGDALWPTISERAAAEAAARRDAEAAHDLAEAARKAEETARKAELAAREAEAAAREAEAAARRAAEAEVERLRAELARLRGRA